MFTGRWCYALLLLPVAGAAWVVAALLRVWDIWFLNNPSAVLWTIAGLIPYLLCFLATLIAVRSTVHALGIASAAAGTALMLPGLWLSATFGEGTLISLTFLPLYTWVVIVIALIAVGGSYASSSRQKSLDHPS
jgi:hypothetical protein